jgi:hypothetical protein
MNVWNTLLVYLSSPYSTFCLSVCLWVRNILSSLNRMFSVYLDYIIVPRSVVQKTHLGSRYRNWKPSYRLWVFWAVSQNTRLHGVTEHHFNTHRRDNLKSHKAIVIKSQIVLNHRIHWLEYATKDVVYIDKFLDVLNFGSQKFLY